MTPELITLHQRILDEQGYIVVTSKHPHAKGEVLESAVGVFPWDSSTHFAPRTFAVLDVAESVDLEIQSKKYFGVDAKSEWPYHYKVIAE